MSDALPIFVGSTFVDLEAHRAVVLSAIQRLEAVARGMEHFGARPGMPKEECLRIVRGCRVYVGIFAMRYGSIDPDTGKSLTELEYDEAQRFHLLSLIYLIDEERQPVLPKHVDFGVSAEKLEDLKSRLKQRHVVSFFTTPDDLAMRVGQDIGGLVQGRGLSIQPSTLSRIIDNSPKIDWLNDDRFGFLKNEIGSLADPIGSEVILREAVQFILSGDNQSAALLITRSTCLDLREAIDLLMAITQVLGRVIARGYKVMEQDGRVSPDLVREFEDYVSTHSRLPPQGFQHRSKGADGGSNTDPDDIKAASQS